MRKRKLATPPETVKAPENFEVAEGYACWRPTGQLTLNGALDLLGKTIAFTHERQIKRLLVDTTNVKLLKNPSLMQRFELAMRFARMKTTPVKVVVVALPENIDPNKFGITVARNRGLFINVFPTEAEALEWLLNPEAG